MHIALLITNFEGGGAQRVVLNLAQEWKNRDHQVTIFTLETLEEYHLPQNLRIVSLSSLSGYSSKLQKALLFPILPFRLAKNVRQREISLCISHLERADFINILGRFLSKHRAITVIHSHLKRNYVQEGVSFRSWIYQKLVVLLTRKADHIVAVSHGIKQGLLEIGFTQKQVSVIYNPFYPQYYFSQAKSPLPQVYQSLYKKNTILISIGRLSKQKGFWHSLKAFAQIKKNYPHLKYVILGDGYLREWLIQYSRTLGLSVYSVWEDTEYSESFDVYFLGFQDNPQAFLSRSFLNILPSHYEGLPNIIIESFLCQTPVIASDCDSGPRELLAPHTDYTQKTSTFEIASHGILTSVGNSDYTQDMVSELTDHQKHLIQAIEVLISDKDLYHQYIIKSKERQTIVYPEIIMDQWNLLLEKD